MLYAYLANSNRDATSSDSLSPMVMMCMWWSGVAVSVAKTQSCSIVVAVDRNTLTFLDFVCIQYSILQFIVIASCWEMKYRTWNDSIFVIFFIGHRKLIYLVPDCDSGLSSMLIGRWDMVQRQQYRSTHLTSFPHSYRVCFSPPKANFWVWEGVAQFPVGYGVEPARHEEHFGWNRSLFIRWL